MSHKALAQRAAALTEVMLRVGKFDSMEVLVATCALHIEARKHPEAGTNLSDLDVANLFSSAIRRYEEQKATKFWNHLYCTRCGKELINGRGGCEGAQHGNKGCAMNGAAP